jgi:predicted secreted protein
LNFGLAPATIRKLDDQRIAAAYKNLNERVAAIAGAMGRNVNEAVIDTIDFEGSGNYAQRPNMAGARAMSADSMGYGGNQVAEPSFEAGETTLNMGLVAKIRFK